MNSCAKLGIWTGILNLAITSFGFPHAITVISSLDNGTFPWTIFDPFLARTLLGFFLGTVFSPSHPYSSSAKDDSKCLGLNDVFQLMDIDCYALTSMRWLAWLRDAQMRLLLGTKAKICRDMNRIVSHVWILNFSSLDSVIAPSNLGKSRFPSVIFLQQGL